MNSESAIAIDMDRAVYHRSVVFVLLSTLLLSFNGTIVRTIEDASTWQVIFFRSTALVVAMSALFLLRHRRRTMIELRRSWRVALFTGPLLGMASIFFIQSLNYTTIANTLFMLSSVPLFAAVLAWLLFGERVNRATVLAIGAAMVGIGIMVVDGISTGSLLGNVLALGTALSFAGFVVSLRRNRNVDMLPAVCVGAAFSAIVGAVMSADFVAPARDIAICIAWGGLLSTTGHALFTYASRHVPAAELTLLGLAEFIIGPIWAWLFISEVPSTTSLFGGLIVVAAIAGRSLSGVRRRPVPRSTV